MTRRLRYRREPCDGCAFHPNSPERADRERWEQLMLSCMHKPFVCHKTALQLQGDRWHGSFDVTRKPDGSPAELSDHMLCAGFARMFGDDLGIDTSTVKGFE